MKPVTNGRRPRGRPNRKQHGGPARPNNFDNAQEGRGRGNAHQVYERYLALARDAVTAGDRVASETYYQHAEHYFRVLNASTDPQPNGQGRPDRHGGDTRPEGGQQEGGQQDSDHREGGRRQDHRQDGHRHEANRTDAQESGETQGGGQPPTPPVSSPPTSTPHEPAANGQDTPPVAARPANQGGRHRRPPPVRNAPVRDATPHDGGQHRGDAPQAQSNAQPEPQPQPEAQPGPRIDGGCEPTGA
jgi:hypothetical protein